jgi:prepilin-type N-terminal cleavage/methylation domain-containing protein/prepilin-type processing-associated H-X9-DG protein
MNRSMAAGSRRGFTLVEMLVVIAIIGTLMSLLLPAVQQAREWARNAKCKANMSNLAKASIAFADLHGTYPRISLESRRFDTNDGQMIVTRLRGHRVGWEIELLMHLEGTSFVRSFTPGFETLDEDNLRLIRNDRDLPVNVPAVYQCPSARDTFEIVDDDEIITMSYAAVMGARLPVREGTETRDCGAYHRDGIIYPGSKTRHADIDINDGATNTILFGERLYLLQNWITSVRLESNKTCVYHAKNIKYRVNSTPQEHAEGTDPSAPGYDIGYYKNDPELEDLEVTDNSNPPLFNDLPFASRHPGGANFTFAGGRVAFLTEFTDLDLLKNMATIRGGRRETSSIFVPDSD